MTRPDRRAARRRALLGAAAVAHTQWQDECAAVRSEYRRWTASPAAQMAVAFRAYSAALDREERAADSYARLISRAGQVETGRPIALPAEGVR
jgi:hypothetical protein